MSKASQLERELSSLERQIDRLYDEAQDLRRKVENAKDTAEKERYMSAFRDVDLEIGRRKNELDALGDEYRAALKESN
jgi:predicted  nucleic acid-binding Zn-ribbon protein